MMMKTKMKMMMMKKIASMNVHNSLMMNQDIEIFEPMFDLLRFENNEIREMMIDRFEEIADLMKTEEIEIEHLEIEPLESESMQ
jgi:hypothetical protein